ncbi:hypothetical protein E3T55_18590 [Cryobacterium frigoriphilum]|uniref:DUF3068 domain-containing protein n=1 Tax=Cryobacterium frigoriphilum TaxID=1259150 RepID=A0A4R8ZU84_9MICO|nr:hypothetical protein [Cryobacterium frigoriphilum]TFD45666.1 hypothetical protein E3T55_18590 [Cryobacterium frigoriphilum]
MKSPSHSVLGLALSAGILSASILTASTGCAPAQVITPASAADLPRGSTPVQLDPSAFSVTIDNPYWPMMPGTQWTYRETDGTGDELTVTVTVTHDTRLIANGITARVVRDTVRRGSEVIEDTFDWYAQDHQGTVWYLGEDTAEFENGVISSTAGSFEAGVDGALPGVVMPADPVVGLSYRQEYYAGEAEDNGEVLSRSELAQVPFGQFSDVVLTKDTITIEPDVAQYKLYAPGIGPVLVVDVSGGAGGREELVSMSTVPLGTGTGPLGAPQ